jgi:hypothetical protein
MNPNKVKAILKVKTPQTKKQVRSFLGNINYYAKFLPCLSEIARPIARLTGKTVPFVWNEEAEEAFQRLKERIAADVMLAFPDQDRPFTVTTDASEYAIGAVLSQMDPTSGIERPVMFLSKALDRTQSNWCTPEKELYAVVYALEKFRPYIYARPFTLVTDHRALLWCCGKRNVHGQLARWSVTISQYAQDIKYIQGRNNHVADALSRAPFQEEPSTGATDDISCNDLIDEGLRDKVYAAVGLDVRRLLSKRAAVFAVQTRAQAARDRLEGHGMRIESETDESDLEMGPPLDLEQVRLTPVFTAELWSTSTNEDPDPRRLRPRSAGTSLESGYT